MQLTTRQEGSDSTDQFLNLIADPFQAEVQESSVVAAVVWSFVVSGGLFLLFCWLRPRNSTVYARRAKHADEKHAPLRLDRKPFSWVRAIKEVKEQDLVDKIGLDAVIFLRFLRMLRNIFIILTVFGLGILIPVNIVGGSSFYEQWDNIAILMKFTPQYIFGEKFWAYVICAYLFQGTICFFIWRNYKAVYRLKRAYFNSAEYQRSLHSRTLLLTNIPKPSRTDTGITELVEQARRTHDVPRTAIGRNVKDLPELIDAHEEAVRELEGHLANYLHNPNKLPEKRPTCKVAEEDKATQASGEVDAIDYYTDRITTLEADIKQVRESIDMRDPMSYGFASYTHIEDAHAVAYTSRKKGPAGCDVHLAPKPNDILWRNLTMSRATRRARKIWDGLWMVVFTMAFIVPNILTSVFLSDFSHLGLVWPAFQSSLEEHRTAWSVMQGILAPLVQTLMYMGVPIIFRRLYNHSGDVSKTSRERHVTSRLYAFLTLNNLVVFSLFGSAWRFVASVIAAKDQGIWEAIRSSHLFSNIMTGLFNVSTFWLTWQMQRNLSAATDLIQAWPLVWAFIQKRWYSPTPRQLIELTAPEPFEYTEYYSNFLLVTTVGLCFGAIQPIILPITAFYLAIDVWFKKYLLQYVFITKTESGGRFWRLIVNRLMSAVVLSNAVIALVVGAQGIGSINSVGNGTMLYAMIPLPFLLAGFKWYCKRTYDDKLTYYATQSFSDMEGNGVSESSKPKRSDKVAVRFGHPALYKRLLTPMVHAKSQHLLKQVYGHRSNTHHDANIFADRSMPSSSPLAYSDVYMAELDPQEPGKPAAHDIPRMEFVAEQDLDFENFKKRAEFRDHFGGELYDSSRPGTPSTFATFSTLTDVGLYGKGKGGSNSSTRNSSRTRLAESVTYGDEQGTEYEQGYRPTPPNERLDSVDLGISNDPFGLDDVLRVRRSEHGRDSVGERLLGEDNADYFGAGKERDTAYDRYRQK